MLRVDLADFDQQSGHALYSAFAIGSELEGYSLKMLGKYSGDAGMYFPYSADNVPYFTLQTAAKLP